MSAHQLKLVVDRVTFGAQLDESIEEGQQLLERSVTNQTELRELCDDYETWDDYNSTLLRNSFDSDDQFKTYSSWTISSVVMGEQSFPEELRDKFEDIRAKLRRLKSVKIQLPLFIAA